MLSRTDSHRHEDKQGVWLDAGHDGYADEFGLVHRRRLFVSASGGEVRGEDILEASPERGAVGGMGAGGMGVMDAKTSPNISRSASIFIPLCARR